MKSRLSLSILLLLAALLPANTAGATPKDDNVIIDDELRVYTISEKRGSIYQVKAESDTWYEALKKEGYADAVTIYNENISIDKASAPGAKPFYRSWESPDVFYNGAKLCLLHIPLAKGKKAKASFVQTYKAPEHFCNIMLTSSQYRKKHMKALVKVPAALAESIKVTPYKFTENITLSSETHPNGSVTYTIEATDLEPWRYESRAPEASTDSPQIIITGQFADAPDLYRHFLGYLDTADGDSPEITDIAGKLRAKASSDEALIDSTAAWVRQNIRYLAVEHGEYAFRPASAAEVIRSRAGDCKGSANLIKALLRKNGLDGRLAWVGTKGDIAFDWDEVPALCSGNHVIAACLHRDSIIYLDGTTTWASPGYIPPSIRGRRVMIEDGDNCIITNVSETGREADTERISADFSISDNDLAGEIKVRLSGVAKMSLLSSMAGHEPRHRMNIAGRYISYPKKNTETDDIRIDADLSRDEVVITASVRETNGAQKIGDRIYIDLKPIRDSFLTVADTTDRTHDYVLPFGYTAEYDFTVKLPDGYRPASLPEPVGIYNEWHEASLEYTETEGTLRCRVRISAKELRVPLHMLPGRNEAVRKLLRAADTKLVLTPA